MRARGFLCVVVVCVVRDGCGRKKGEKALAWAGVRWYDVGV